MSEHNVYRNALGTLYLTAYVDDLLSFQVDHSEVTRVLAAIQAQVLLRPTAELLVSQTIAFLGRQLAHEGEYIEGYLWMQAHDQGPGGTEHAGQQTCQHSRDGSLEINGQ